MSSTSHSEIQVLPGTGPQVVSQPYANKYCDRAEEPGQPSPPHERRPRPPRGCWTLAVFTVLCMAVALGAGLGAGLAIHRKSNPTTTSANAATRLPDVTTATPAPATQTTTFFAATTATLAPATQTTISSAGCPAANGSTYTITNQVAPTARPYTDAIYSSIAYMILCDTNYSGQPTMVDLQALSNTSSLGDCLNACALYSFQAPPWDFPAYFCSGLAWESENKVCWLKSNVTLSSPQQSMDPMPDGAVMITTY